MKACGVCGRLYEDEDAFCQADGKELIRVSQVPVPSSDDDPRVGQLILERYLIFRVVADGSMGRVYEALDQQSQRHVAVKILHKEVARDSVSVERFRREFEVSAQLPHDHVVDVIDFRASSDGSYALTMEFLVGEELSAMLSRETVMPPERCVRMLSQVALGIDLAHAKKLVHRDLKPDNIFLCQTKEGDVAKVLDFGSVKDKRESAKQLTVLGTTIGSPFYMSPEQAQGLDTLDHRADVWAMAAIVYECITGGVPFQGANGPSILMQILSKEPAPPSVAAAGRAYPVPVDVDVAIQNALKKNAAVRTPTVGQLADDFGRAYGLEGEHKTWAQTTESELGEIIQRKLPAILRMKTPSSRPADALGDFFGEDNPLGKEERAEAVVKEERAEAVVKEERAEAIVKEERADLNQDSGYSAPKDDKGSEAVARGNLESVESQPKVARGKDGSSTSVLEREPLQVPTVSLAKTYLAIGLAVLIVLVLVFVFVL